MTVTSIFPSVQLTELQYESRRRIKMSGGEILSAVELNTTCELANYATEAGSAQPPLEPGKVRLYGFEYSPYVQRVHMVLITKNIPHDVKNIDLKNKPDWFLKLNPAGKVPVLDTGDKVLTESLEIVVFLDKNYPGTSLRNTDPEKSAKDREIVEKFEGLRTEFHEAIKNKDYQSPVTIACLSLFQSELEKRGTTFLAGDSPGLADFIIWPWFERLKVTRELHGKAVEFNTTSALTNYTTEALDLPFRPPPYTPSYPEKNLNLPVISSPVYRESVALGSAQPPLEPGKVRLYGFGFSPYVQRVHMVLIAKNIPHDVKSIDLKNKPDWFLKLNPAGKVPVLDTGDKVLTESLDIIVYLDQNYPGTSLRSTDPEKSAKDKEIVKKFEEYAKEFRQFFTDKDFKPSEGTRAFYSLFQSELEKRGTTFLGGDSPGLVDYIIWPWFERIKVARELHGKGDVEIPEDKKTKAARIQSELNTTSALVNYVIEAAQHTLSKKTLPSTITPEPALREQQCSLYLAVLPFSPPPSYVRMRTTVKYHVTGTEEYKRIASVWVYYELEIDSYLNQSERQPRRFLVSSQYTAGSTEPPKEEGKSRLYSMHYCPFAQRARIICNVKKIPHDIVNIDLKNKPDWYFKIHPKGLVPALDLEGQILVESLDIAEFLNERFPDPPLYPADPEKKAKDKELIEKFGKVVATWAAALYKKDGKTNQERIQSINDVLLEMETELEERGTTFYGGDTPGMVDYMIWPWVERARVPSLIDGEDFDFPKDKLSKLVVWKNEMKERKEVKDTITDPQIQATFYKGYLQGKPNYDL
uniref:Uncharacterized protein n=1 Tax=Timema shepardi TaxID=629360 RepID=A0A7R9AKJ0_TIMSH|nr:unnamed protein product [Timema shepardi]